jgi:ABC-type microcin C transport system duplicated ATPase subunit YejF
MTLIDSSAPAAWTSGPVMDVRDLRVWYGTPRGAIRAVDGVTFALEGGQTLGLVGEGLNETVNPLLRKQRLVPVEMTPREPVEP